MQSSDWLHGIEKSLHEEIEKSLHEEIEKSLNFKIEDLRQVAEEIKNETEEKARRLKQQWNDFVKEHNVAWTTTASNAGISLMGTAIKAPREAFYAHIKNLTRDETKFAEAAQTLKGAQVLYEREKAARLRLLKCTLELAALQNVEAVAKVLEQQFKDEASALQNR